MHTKVFVDIHLYADEEVVLTARINRIKCTHTYKCYTAKSINLLWNIPLSNESSAAMNLFIKWNFCSSSCKINLHSRWTRMSVFDIPACTKVSAAVRVIYWDGRKMYVVSVLAQVGSHFHACPCTNFCSPQLKPHIRVYFSARAKTTVNISYNCQ